MEIKSISVMSAAKVFYFVSFGFTLIIVFLNLMSWLRGQSQTICSSCTLRTVIGVPLLVALMGFFVSFLYNRMAARFGGLQMTIEDKE